MYQSTSSRKTLSQALLLRAAIISLGKINSLTKRITMRSATLVVVSIAAFVLLATHASTNSLQSTEAITVHAEHRGNPRMNLQDGRSTAATYKNLTTKVVSNLFEWGAASVAGVG